MRTNGQVRIFFEENSQKLFGYIMKMVGNREDAEDCYQDCFIKYSEKYSDRFTVARSVCIDSIRKRRSNSEYLEDTAEGARSAEAEAISNETVRNIQSAMDKLDDDEKELLAMAGSQGLKYAEIAEVTGMSVPNIKVKIHRARVKMKKMLAEERV
jgi:RNA polymerase sigma-70 factor (ECF subfamily)